MRLEYEKLATGSKNVLFTGMLPKDEVTKILRQVDILYFATHSNGLSKYGQSLNKVIDYMSAGKVIIGSYSGFPSMINEAECGEFIPENSVCNLVETITKYCEMAPRVREEIGLRGRQWLIEERSFRKLALVYERALESL
jgi:glycosyltransferase involved in cell wall biosynthesis